MTMIIAAVARDLICVVSDSRLTDIQGQQTPFDYAKCHAIQTIDANTVVQCAGRVDMPNSSNIMGWIAEYASKSMASKATTDDFVHGLASALETELSDPYPERARALVLMLAGRRRDDQKPLLYKISNINTEIGTDVNEEQASNEFVVRSIELSKNPKKIVVDGFLEATKGTRFRTRSAEAKSLLDRRNHGSLGPIIRNTLIDCVLIAATDPLSRGLIGDRVIGSILNPNGTLSVVHVPDDGTRTLPGSSNSNLSVVGLKITGNPPGEGADYTVGGLSA